MPVGGSDARGAFGHALAAVELASQMHTRRRSAMVGRPGDGDRRHAGGDACRAWDGSDAAPGRHGVRRREGCRRAALRRLSPRARRSPPHLGTHVDAADVVVDASMLGAGYGAPTTEAQAAIELLARGEGVFADPVYTGKALAGLHRARPQRAASPPATRCVFLHTGGAPRCSHNSAAYASTRIRARHRHLKPAT